MSYFGAFVLIAIFFCLGIMAGMLLAFNGIIEIISGLVDFLVERREYVIPDDDIVTED